MILIECFDAAVSCTVQELTHCWVSVIYLGSNTIVSVLLRDLVLLDVQIESYKSLSEWFGARYP